MKTRWGVDYGWLLDSLGSVAPVIDGGPLTLRHDVDNILSVAMDMARLEHSRGVRSTYYLLTPAWGQTNYLGTWANDGRWFTFSDEALTAVDELREMGHEVGYHNNLLTVSKQSGIDPFDLLEVVMTAWATRGLYPIGTASHGDREAGQGGYVNYDFLKDADLQQLGLRYEAYWLPRKGYLSDSGGNLNGRPEPTQAVFAEEIAKLERPAQVLIHPCWWKW